MSCSIFVMGINEHTNSQVGGQLMGKIFSKIYSIFTKFPRVIYVLIVNTEIHYRMCQMHEQSVEKLTLLWHTHFTQKHTGMHNIFQMIHILCRICERVRCKNRHSVNMVPWLTN